MYYSPMAAKYVIEFLLWCRLFQQPNNGCDIKTGWLALDMKKLQYYHYFFRCDCGSLVRLAGFNIVVNEYAEAAIILQISSCLM